MNNSQTPISLPKTIKKTRHSHQKIKDNKISTNWLFRSDKFTPCSPILGGLGMEFIRSWNSIQKLSLNIPCQVFIYLHKLFSPLGIQALCKMNFYLDNLASLIINFLFQWSWDVSLQCKGGLNASGLCLEFQFAILQFISPINSHFGVKGHQWNFPGLAKVYEVYCSPNTSQLKVQITLYMYV